VRSESWVVAAAEAEVSGPPTCRDVSDSETRRGDDTMAKLDKAQADFLKNAYYAVVTNPPS